MLVRSFFTSFFTWLLCLNVTITLTLWVLMGGLIDHWKIRSVLHRPNSSKLSKSKGCFFILNALDSIVKKECSPFLSCHVSQQPSQSQPIHFFRQMTQSWNSGSSVSRPASVSTSGKKICRKWSNNFKWKSSVSLRLEHLIIHSSSFKS